METNNRNFFITIILSVAILTLWQVFYMNPRIEAERKAAEVEAARVEEKGAATQPAAPPATNVPGVVPGADGAAAEANRESALAATQRVRIDTPSIAGSISLTGGRIDDVKLKHYHATVDDSSPIIELLNPSNMPAPSASASQFVARQFVEIGYRGDETTGAVPDQQAVWTAEGNQTLTPSTPVTLSFTNDKGLAFKRTISVDADYMFKITDAVTNGGAAPVAVRNYGRVTRLDQPTHASIYVLHEGLIGVTGEEGLHEISYSTMHEDKEVKPSTSTDGWLGITDKYWAATVVPSGKQPFQPIFSYFENNGQPLWQSSFVSDQISIAPGQTQTVETLVFAGAKVVEQVNQYETRYNIRQFNLLIDWGWFYFITKPMFWLIDHLYKLLGNFGLAILATTVIVKAFFFPLANKSYKSMANMKKVQPKMLEIREKYADDKMKQQQAMMELYKTEKINPIAGCWPVLIQIPVFFALYKVLYVTIEMRHAPFYGWIHDLAAPDPTSIFNLFGLLPFAVPAYLLIGVWPLIMGVTMFLQMRMNPTPPDPTQAMIFTWMPVIFTFMLASFPAGLVIYWAWNNLLSIIQQGVIMKRQGAKIELWDNLAGMFRRKPSPAE